MGYKRQCVRAARHAWGEFRQQEAEAMSKTACIQQIRVLIRPRESGCVRRVMSYFATGPSFPGWRDVVRKQIERNGDRAIRLTVVGQKSFVKREHPVEKKRRLQKEALERHQAKLAKIAHL